MTTHYGNGFIMLGLLVWMSVVTGPWWIGLILFLVGWIVNLTVMLVREHKKGGLK